VKPQYGVFLPVLLLLGRHWVAMASAAATVAMSVVVSATLFGSGAWINFVESISVARDHYLDGGPSLVAMHSVYAVLASRFDASMAVIVRGVVAGIGFALTVLLWRRGAADPSLRNAATIGLAFLATPYVFQHEVPMLALGAAMLAWGREPMPRGSSVLLGLLVLVTPLPLVPSHGAPGALLAGALILLAFAAARRTPPSTPPAAPYTAAAQTASRAG